MKTITETTETTPETTQVIDVLGDFLLETPKTVIPPATAPVAPVAPASKCTWADVHAKSLVAGRWYQIPGSDEPWRLTGDARTVGVGKYATVCASFERPRPDENAQTCQATATPETPFVEIPSPVTKSGREKKSETREKSALLSARCTIEEKAAVTVVAAAAGMSVSAYIRQLLGLSEERQE